MPVESGPAGAGGGAGAAPQTPLPPPKSPSGSWGAVGLILAPSLERLWGACGGRESLPNEVRRLPRDNPRRPKPPPWSASGGRASRGGPGASRRQPRRPKRGLPPQTRAGFNKYQKRMNISQCAHRRGEKPILVNRGCRANANHDVRLSFTKIIKHTRF